MSVARISNKSVGGDRQNTEKNLAVQQNEDAANDI